ncbi:MAG: TonB-dependent receptor plug domain-containing protein [Opitutaceae bacterium]|nr:TonB-dependent receptor plug domain-containing protein [Opitutaceae bacterium]
MNSRTLRSLVALGAALAASAGRAQTAPKPAAAGEETITLSPFTVNTSKDIGYIAADSLLAGRLSTELLKTPSDITVLTRDFINDIAATDYLEASAYLTNTYATQPAGQDFGAQNNFRGLGGGFPTRNYFKHNNTLDFYNVERVESARGPNALLFGDGIVGGIINTVTKQAKLGRTFHQFNLRTDSEGSLRGNIDSNVAFGRYAAVRVNLVKADDRNWVDTYFRNLVGATVAATYKPWLAGELRLEAETGDLKQNYARQNFGDSVSNWNGVAWPGFQPTTPAGAVGVGRFTTDRLIDLPGVGLVNLLNFGNTQGSNFAIDPNKRAFLNNLPAIPRNFSLQPSNAYGDTRRHLVALFYQHEWSKRLFSEVAFQFAGYKRATFAPGFGTLQRDINLTLPGGAANPAFGKLYADAAPANADQDNRHYDTRFVTAYELPIRAWKQTVNVMASRRVEYFFALDSRWMRTNNAAVPLLTNGANQYFFRQYEDNIRLVPQRPADTATYTWESIPTRYRSQRQQLDTVQAATVSNFWDERITFVGGFRRDKYASREYAVGSFSPVTGRPATLATLKKELTANVFSAGVTVFPVRALGVYANVSETFNPIGDGDPSLYLKQFDQTSGLGYSAGFRFRLLEGRIVGSVGWYDTTEENRVTGYGVTEINRIWNNINRTDRTFPTSYRDTSDISSEGYELDVVANLTKNFRLRGNIATPQTKQSNALPDTIKYFNENLPVWQAALSEPTTTNPNQINSDIAALRTRIQSGNEGRALNNQADYNGSIFGNYTFDRGALNRFSLGGGITVLGRRIIGNQTTNAFDYIKAPAYYTLSATAGYSLKIAGRNVRLQLNVNNLLDYDEPFYTNVRTLAGRNYRDAFYYLEPRKFILSATLDL